MDTSWWRDVDKSLEMRETGPTAQLEHGTHITVKVPTQTVVLELQ